jgi:hypothetical protein
VGPVVQLCIAVVAHGAAHNGPVLLFDVGVVILAPCTAMGEGDFLAETVTVELVIDELGTI